MKVQIDITYVGAKLNKVPDPYEQTNENAPPISKMHPPLSKSDLSLKS